MAKKPCSRCEELVETLGRVRDTLENLLAASTLPGLPARIHVEGLTGGCRELVERINAIPEVAEAS